MTSKPPKSKWVRFDRALSIIAQQSHGEQRDPTIREALEAALAEGVIHSRLDRESGWPGDFSKGKDLPPGFWAPDNSTRTSLGPGIFGCVGIHLEGLTDWLDGPQPTSRGVKRGPKFQWDWEAFWIEVSRRRELHGLPEKQAEFVAIMKKWFMDTVGDEPADSEIRKRISRLYHQRDADN